MTMFLSQNQRSSLQAEINIARSNSEKTVIASKYRQISNLQTNKLINLIKSCNSPTKSK